MTTVTIFKGNSNVNEWLMAIKAKLISKGYKSQLDDENRPVQNGNAKIAWDTLADKALGTILMHISADVAIQFEDKQTPQTLLDAIKSHYAPNQHQAIERLETELSRLEYDGEDPVSWLAGVKGLIAKLTSKGAAPQDRSVRMIVLKALCVEPEYKTRVEVIRQTQPDISLAELWTAIGRFTYPIVSDDSAFVMNNKLTSDNRMNRIRHVRENYGRRPQKEREDDDKPRKEASNSKQDDKIAFKAGLCYNCGEKGHRKFECPELEVSNNHKQKYKPKPNNYNNDKYVGPDKDRNRDRNNNKDREKYNNKDKERNRDKNKDRDSDSDKDSKREKEKPKPRKSPSPTRKPKTYALFSQTLDEADHLRVAKKPRERVSSGSSGSSRGREDSKGSDSGRVSYHLQQLQQQMQQPPYTTPTPLQMPYIPDSDRIGVWGECSKVSDSKDIAEWMTTDPFVPDSIEDIVSDNMSFRHIGVEPSQPIGEGMEESLVMIVREAVVDTGPIYQYTDLFGLLRLTGGAIYNRVDIAGLVLKKLSDQCGKTLVEYETRLAELTSKLERRVVWMVWREAALMNILVCGFFQELTRYGTKMNTLDRWLGMAGLDVNCARIPNTITTAQGWAMIRRESRDVTTNIGVCLGELVRCECQLLLEKHKSFAWLSDIRVVSLTGVSGEKLVGRYPPTLALVTSQILSHIHQHWGNKVSLGEIHSIMSKLERSDPLDTLYGMPTDFDDVNLLTNSLLLEDKDDADFANYTDRLDSFNKINTVVINNNDVTNCNKFNNCNFDEIFSHTTTHTNKNEWCGFNSEVQEALNKDDLTQCWVADSGATKHMTGNKEWLSELK